MYVRSIRERMGVIAIFLCLVLSACTDIATLSPEVAVTSAPARTLTPAPETANTPTATKRPFRTPTPTRRYTGTALWYSVGETAWANFNLRRGTETVSPNTTIAAIDSRKDPTEAKLKTQLAQFPGLCEDYFLRPPAFSPDGNWMAVLCNEKYGAHQTLEVVNQNGTRWVVYYKDFLANSDKEDLPRGGLYPRYWSQDGKYLYFAPKIGYSGGGACLYQLGVQALVRLTLADGTVSVTLPVLEPAYYYNISFSPTGRRIAFIGYDGPVTILDLHIGERIIVEDSDRPTGNFAWSPDGLNLAYAICETSKDSETITKSAIKVFSTQSGELTTILTLQNVFLTVDGWGENDLLKIDLHEYSNYDPGEYRYYHWSSGQFVTPTPTP